MMTSAGSAVELHGDRQALDHVGAVPGDRSFGDRLNRPEIGAGVVFGDPDDQAGDRQSDDAADEQRQAGIVHAGQFSEPDQQPHDQRDADQRQPAGRDQAAIERAHDRLVGREFDEEGAGDRGEDADAADRERQGHHLEQDGGAAEEDRCQHHGGNGGHRIGLEQVGRHTGTVADIVADIVGNRGRIARIVLRNSRLDLADQVAADIGTLGEDAAAQPREDRNQRGAEAERHHRIDDGAVIGGEAERAGQVTEIKRDAEQRQARHQHAGDGAGLERNIEAAGERTDRRLCGSHIGAHRHVHADESGEPRQYRPDGETDRHEPTEKKPDDREDHDADDRDGAVLAPQIGLGADTHGGGDLLHSGIAGVGLHYRLDRPDGIGDCQRPTQDDDPQDCH